MKLETLAKILFVIAALGISSLSGFVSAGIFIYIYLKKKK